MKTHIALRSSKKVVMKGRASLQAADRAYVKNGHLSSDVRVAQLERGRPYTCM